MKMRAVGFDQGSGQGKVDAGAEGRLVRRRLGPERLHRCGDFFLVEPLAGVSDPQHHLVEIRQRGGNDDLAAGLGEMDGVADQVEASVPLTARAG